MNHNQDNAPANGRPAHKKNRKLYNLVAGAALAAAVALGGNAALTTPSVQAAALTSNSAAFDTVLLQTSTQNTTQNAGKGNRRGAQRGASGTLSAINADIITLKQGDVVVIQATLNANTVYTKAGQTITKNDLKVGQAVSVRTTTATDGTVSVSQVEVILNHASGTISAVDANSLTLTKADNTAVKVSLDSAAKYLDLGKTISQSDLKNGIKVEVAGELNADGSIKAETVTVQHDRLGGTVTAINGATITVQVNGRGGNGGRPANGTTPTSGTGTATPTTDTTTPTTKTITVTGNTVYLEGGQSVQLSNVSAGERIEAAGNLSSDGNSLSALQVMIALPRYDGQVTSINGATIVLQDRSGTVRTIEINSNTKYLNGQATAALSDIKAGLNIHVEGQVDASGKMSVSVVQLGQGQAAGGKGGR